MRFVVANAADDVRRHVEHREFGVELDKGRDRLFADAAIVGVVGKAGARRRDTRLRCAADVILRAQQFGHLLELEGVDRRRQRGIVRSGDALELVGQAGEVEEIVGHRGCAERGTARVDAAPGLVLDEAVGGPHLVIDVREAPVDAAQEIAVVVVMPLKLELVDLVLEIRVAERVAGRRDQRRVQRVDTRIHLVRDDRQVVLEIDALRLDAEDRATDRGAAAVIVGRLGDRGRVMRIERHRDVAGRFPGQIAAERLVLGLVGTQRAAVRQVLAGREILGIEDRARRGAVGPGAARVAEVEPDADAAVAHLDLVARIGEVQRRGQRVGRLGLQHELAVDALAVDVDDVVVGALRDFIDIGRARAIGDVRSPRRTRLRERTPVVLGSEKTVAKADA